MTIIISNARASSLVYGGRDYDVTIREDGNIIHGMAIAMFDAVNGAWSANWASCPEMWLSDSLIDYADVVADNIPA